MTLGERLWIWRKTQGLTLDQAAKQLGIGRGRLQAMEAGEAPLGRLRPLGGLPTSQGGLALALTRKRSGLGLAAVAAALGVSRVTVLAWERAGDPRLKTFWRARK